MTLDLLVSFSDNRWRACGAGVDVEHTELRALDTLVETRLAQCGAQAAAMRFDVSSLPPWMRQYQTHYFNYTLHA